MHFSGDLSFSKYSISLSAKKSMFWDQSHLTGKNHSFWTHLEGINFIFSSKPNGKITQANFTLAKSISTRTAHMNCISKHWSFWKKKCYQVIKLSSRSAKPNTPGSYKLLADIVEARCSLLSSALGWIPLSLLRTVLGRNCNYYTELKLPALHRYYDNKASSYTWSWTQF